jgi:hypothetical protein
MLQTDGSRSSWATDIELEVTSTMLQIPVYISIFLFFIGLNLSSLQIITSGMSILLLISNAGGGEKQLQLKIKSCQLLINFMRQYMKVQLFHVRAVTNCTILQLLKLMIFKIHGGQFYLL